MQSNNRLNIQNGTAQTFVSPQISNNSGIMKHYNITEIKKLTDTAKSIMIVVPQINIDAIASALAMALAFKKKNIQASVFCPQKTDNNYSKLSGLDLLTDKIETGDLTITVNHPLDQIDKVSYNDDGGHLNLVVKTKDGSEQISNDKIAIQNQSAPADLCFMLGDETALGDKADIVKRGDWVFISPIKVEKPWAKASLIDPSAPFSEIFTFLLPMLGMPLDMDSGKNLLIALRVSTQSFAVNVSPESFEAGAICLRATQPAPATPMAQPAMMSQNMAMPQTQPQTPVNNPLPITAVEKSGSITPTNAGQNKANPVGIS
ncbi:hypothetical protein DRH14_00675 [Candidatus Shapirobacteria bacterium]|nr:MAG: hypothetical protein DRH14_00675 [Candidatus Shapirobacteria bacterium]